MEIEESKTKISEFSMIICKPGYPNAPINCDQAISIQALLVEEIYSIPDGSFVPEFYGSEYIDGTVVMLCANIESKDWLSNRFAQKTWPVNGGWPKPPISLKIIPTIEIPKLLRFKVTIAKNIGIGNQGFDYIFKLLSKQNPNLKNLIDHWKFYEKEDTEYYLGLDERSVEIIKTMNCKLALGLGHVIFEFCSTEEEA